MVNVVPRGYRDSISKIQSINNDTPSYIRAQYDANVMYYHVMTLGGTNFIRLPVLHAGIRLFEELGGILPASITQIITINIRKIIYKSVFLWQRDMRFNPLTPLRLDRKLNIYHTDMIPSVAMLGIGREMGAMAPETIYYASLMALLLDHNTLKPSQQAQKVHAELAKVYSFDVTHPDIPRGTKIFWTDRELLSLIQTFVFVQTARNNVIHILQNTILVPKKHKMLALRGKWANSQATFWDMKNKETISLFDIEAIDLKKHPEHLGSKKEYNNIADIPLGDNKLFYIVHTREPLMLQYNQHFSETSKKIQEIHKSYSGHSLSWNLFTRTDRHNVIDYLLYKDMDRSFRAIFEI
jgi:hypothetical protein